MDNEFNYASISYAKIIDRKKRYNKVYQDYNASCSFEDGFSVVALADGLGSCRMSDVGAKIAVETAIKFLHEYFAKNLRFGIDVNEMKIHLLNAIKKEIEKQSIKDGIDNLREYSSTLLFSVIALDSNEITFGQIGDGYTIIKENDEEYRLPDDEADYELADDELEYDLDDDER